MTQTKSKNSQSIQSILKQKKFDDLSHPNRQALASWMRSKQEKRVPEQKIEDDTLTLANFMIETFQPNYARLISKTDDNLLLEPSTFFVSVTYNPLQRLNFASTERRRDILDTSQAASSSIRVTKSNEYQARFFEHLFRHTVKSFDKHPDRCPLVIAFLDKKEKSTSIGEELFHTHAIVIVPDVTKSSFEAYFSEQKYAHNHPLVASVQTVDCQEVNFQDDLPKVFSYAAKYFTSRSSNSLGSEAKAELFDMYGPVKRGERIARMAV